MIAKIWAETSCILGPSGTLLCASTPQVDRTGFRADS